jgi:ABC-2 type transport system permease protein
LKTLSSTSPGTTSTTDVEQAFPRREIPEVIQFLRGFSGVFVLDMKRLWFNRMRVGASLVQPLMYLFILGSGIGAGSHLGGPGYRRYIFPGVIVMSLLFNGSSAAIAIVVDRQLGFLKAILAAPVPRSAIVAGKIASGAVQSSVPALLLLVLAPLIDVRLDVATVARLLPVMALVAIVFSAMGVGGAARLRSITLSPVFSNVVLLPLFFLSGAIYQLDRAPTWLVRLAYLNPAAYAVDLLRAALHMPTIFPGWLSIIVLFAYLALFTLLAGMIFNSESD